MTDPRPTCFVVQGFGLKPNPDGEVKVLDLDASYAVIREAVEAAGLRCVRADEIVHTGTIDIPMYEMLLRADIVIADLSTSNINAAFELGVRYALRPHATIVLADESFKSPFDINHIVIRRYRHLGEDLGRREAARLSAELQKVIAELRRETRTDSPVYSMLPGLKPPLDAALAEVQRPAGAGDRLVLAPSAPEVAPPSAREWLDRARAAMAKSDFTTAKTAWATLRQMAPHDAYVVQQLALATYKAKEPDADQALCEARSLLQTLAPGSTNDPETLGLWGAVHKRLWELHRDRTQLSEAIAACERGYALKQDHYNGINLAYLLNVRAVEHARQGAMDEAVADSVMASRVRRGVLAHGEQRLARDELDAERRYWIVVSLWEASFGLQDTAAQARWDAEARALVVPAWMRQTHEDQGRRLAALMQEFEALRRGA